jgi:hypothetical protein
MYVEFEGQRYFVTDEIGDEISALKSANGSTVAAVAAAIKSAFVVCAQTQSGVLFEIAAKANAELARNMGVPEEQIAAGNETLRRRFAIRDLDESRATIAIVL